MAAQPVQTSD
jgi:Mrp family chromosome partitioning ATPase